MAFINPNMEACHYHAEGDIVVCDLCPHRCRIPDGRFGLCRSRKNENGKLIAYNYGRISTMAVDPIEKKPLYHFHPGSQVFSVGGIGCNLRCQYCQNYTISQSPIGKKRTTYKSPAQVVEFCKQQNYRQIAFTYNEPSIWFEYIRDIAALDPELEIILITNGMINEAPLKELCAIASAMNVDVKSFDEVFYRDICSGDLEAVKHACEVAYASKVHLELTYLVIPGYNDDPTLVGKFIDWVITHLSSDVPVHFTRFHPDYNMLDLRLTSVDTLLRLQELAESKGLNYVYIGNVMSEEGSNTYCPECGELLIKRTGYKVQILGLDEDRCRFCNARTHIIR